MPLFDFTCRACGTVSEMLVRAGSPSAPACRACGSTDVERNPATFAVKSGERTQAFAAANRKRHAEEGRRDTFEREREAERHRREDH
jgi:putative FmdB family regulatory protein